MAQIGIASSSRNHLPPDALRSRLRDGCSKLAGLRVARFDRETLKNHLNCV
jgi:hypothetical protein